MIGVTEQILLAARAPVAGVEFEPRDDIVDNRARDRDFGQQEAERVERHVAGRLSGECLIGLRTDMRDRGDRIMVRLHRATMILPVGQVVGGAAPGVEQPDALARFAVEELARQREAFRSARDAVVRETVEGMCIIGPRLAHYRFSAFIAKIVLCGT